MRFLHLNYILLILVIWTSCSEEPLVSSSSPGISPLEWIIPGNEVLDGGVGLDGIPSVDQPMFSNPEEINPIFDNELVVGIEYNGELRAYPLPILDWHEIVNDKISDLPLAITYCPLTGTAMGWERKIGSKTTTFGVSGLLYNSNLMPYDRLTNSTWSQLKMQCVRGNLVERRPVVYPLIETTFKTWKTSFPNSKIMNAQTGFDRRYATYPYGDYRTNQERLIFPVSNSDDRLPKKERVLAVIMEGKAKAYRFNEFGQGIHVTKDRFQDVSVLLIRSKDHNFIRAFKDPADRIFVPVQDDLPAIMEDDQGNKYDLRGVVFEGPNKDFKLEELTALMAYWFSLPPFYPDIDIYEE